MIKPVVAELNKVPRPFAAADARMNGRDPGGQLRPIIRQGRKTVVQGGGSGLIWFLLLRDVLSGDRQTLQEFSRIVLITSTDNG